MSGNVLATAMKIFLAGERNLSGKFTTPKSYSGAGKQTIKQLVGQGAGVSNIEITDKNIKSFESIARKYGVDFALKKDTTESPPKYLVFFKARDTDAIMAAFREYSTKQLRAASRPSILQNLQNLMEKVKEQVIDTTKNKNRGHEL